MGKPFESFGEFLQSVQSYAHGKFDPRLNTRSPLGGNEAVPADGSFLVAPEFASALIQRAYQTGQILSRCFELPITKSNSIKFPQFDEDSRGNGSRFGGVRAYWANEADAAIPSRPKFSRGELTTKKLIGLVYLTDELYADTAALDVFATAAFSKEMAFAVETAIISGNGVSGPHGFLNSNALIKVPKQVGQAAGTISGQNITDCYSRMWEPSRASAVWLCNGDTEALLMNATTNVNGYPVPLYVPTTDPDRQSWALMMGRCVIPIEQAPLAGAVGDLMFVDLSRYVIALREQQTAISMHVEFKTDQMAFRFTLRVDGMPLDAKPIAPYQVGALTKSPFVCIDQR